MIATKRALATTTDPSQIQDPTQIPPAGSQFAGQSANQLVDVYYGTLPGDLDAQPSAKELLGTSPDTGGLSNADYIYSQVAALYGGADLPTLQSPSGNNVKSVVFVSGSSQGGYGAFHLQTGNQTDFDRIVVDSLTASGSYSAGSGLGTSITPIAVKAPRVFPIHRGPSDLLSVLNSTDERLKTAKTTALEAALKIAGQSTAALKTAIERRNPGALPPKGATRPAHAAAGHNHRELARKLVQANQDLLGLVQAAANISGGRQYLSTALFAAEIVESFQMLTGKANAGQTDGEAVSRVLAFKLAPEIALIPGFSGGVAHQWWSDGHADVVNDNSRTDQDTDGNGGGVMFLLFLTDYLGVPLDQILKAMPAGGGAPLGQTYESLLKVSPNLAQVAGADGKAAFQAMVNLLQQNATNADGSLNVPADGNPFPSITGSKQGGLFGGKSTNTSTLSQDLQAALGLEAQLEQQLASLKAGLQQIQSDISGSPAPAALRWTTRWKAAAQGNKEALGYKPLLPASLVSYLEQRVASFRSPQYDQTLQDEFWPHVYNELPGTGPNTGRLQAITGTNQAPVAVQITGTIASTKAEPDGDLHISFQPDDSSFPTNQGTGESPLEIEIIYAGPVTQQDAKGAKGNYQNPFDISQLAPGVRIQAAGPLIFDRAHGKPGADGTSVDTGLEIHPLAGMTILSGGGAAPHLLAGPATPATGTNQLPTDLQSALGQGDALNQTVGNLTALLQKMKGEAPAN